MIALLSIAVFLQAVPAGRVSKVIGEVDLLRPGETAAARIGGVVVAGDRLRTRQGSSLTLSTDSGAVLELASDSILEMKTFDGGLLPLLTQGSVGVRSSGEPVRIETSYGQIVGTEDLQEFEVRYSGDGIEVLLTEGAVRAEGSDSSKVVFKNAHDSGTRVHEAGSISPPPARETSGTTVIVYPEVVSPTPNARRAPVTPQIPSK